MFLKGFATVAFLASPKTINTTPSHRWRNTVSSVENKAATAKNSVEIRSGVTARSTRFHKMSGDDTNIGGSPSPPKTRSKTTTESPNDDGSKSLEGKSKSRRLYTFAEARKIARGHGFDSYEEFMEYTCPGTYQIPKDADVVWKDDWKGWDDFLGVTLSFEEGRKVARGLEGIESEEEYLKLITSKTIPDDSIASRLPYRPDLKYKAEWLGWDDFLIDG